MVLQSCPRTLKQPLSFLLQPFARNQTKTDFFLNFTCFKLKQLGQQAGSTLFPLLSLRRKVVAAAGGGGGAALLKSLL